MAAFLLVRNKYYSDYGLDYMYDRLREEFSNRGVELQIASGIVCGYSRDGEYSLHNGGVASERFNGAFGKGRLPVFHRYVSRGQSLRRKNARFLRPLGKILSQLRSPRPSATFSNSVDGIVFFDKDVRLARALEQRFGAIYPNGSRTIALCDDKELTYSAVSGIGVAMPKTIIAPLMFDICSETDNDFLDIVESRLEYPIVVKENTGSQGRQVYLATNRKELADCNRRLMHIPHMYQEFVGEKGADIRIYVIGGQVAASVIRKNTTSFKSNVAMGGEVRLFEPSAEMADAAQRISAAVGMSYGSVDFLLSDTPVFLEVNSNAYFKGIEKLGISIADKIADNILLRHAKSRQGERQ